MIRAFVRFGFWLVIRLAYATYRAEGINALLLIMPAKFIVPTLRRYGARIGERVEIHSPLIIHNASPIPGRHYSHLIIGNDCYFGRDVFLDLMDKICVEDNVTISMRATLITHTNVGKSPLSTSLPAVQGPIILCRGAYIGVGATILHGVKIGASAIVGACALVKNNVAAHTVAAGIPAQTVRTMDLSERPESK